MKAQVQPIESRLLGLEFSCQGDFIQIDGKQYFDGSTVFYCSSDGLSFFIEMSAFKLNGEPFPNTTQWEFVKPFPNYNLGSTFNGNEAIITGDVYSDALTNPIVAKAFFQDGQDDRSVTINIVLARIIFKEHENQSYGFDENKVNEVAYSSYISGTAWKSVLLNGSDVFKGEILPSSVYPLVKFHSSDEINFAIQPESPSSSNQDVLVEGNVLGSATIHSQINQNAPCELASFNSFVNVVSYEQVNSMVKFYILSGDNSNGISANDALNRLNEIYSDAVFMWTSNQVDLIPIVVNYDTDGDGKVDIPEMQAIVDECCPPMLNLKHVIFVDEFDFPPGLAGNPYGFTIAPNVRFSFVLTTEPLDDVYNTTAHELGHTLGLQHPFDQFSTQHDIGDDADNIMDYYKYNTPAGVIIAPHNSKFRKYQWDELHD